MRLSVVIPVFNAAGFLEDSLHGLRACLEAHCPDHEIIAANDGSTDGSLELLKTLEGERLRVVSSPMNRGKFAAIRDGMAAAAGSCKAFTDADVPFDHSALPYI